MLSTLLQGGLPLVPSMETAGTSMTSRRILKGVMRASTRVREGRGWPAVWKEQNIFPDLAVEMLEVGESTGAFAGNVEFGGGVLRRRCADGFKTRRWR